MKRKFDELSEAVCKVCGKQIKLRLVEKENPNEYCYDCWKVKEAGRGHFIDKKNRVKRVKAGLAVKAGLERGEEG